MQKHFLRNLTIVAAAIASILPASAGNALSLRTEKPELFNYFNSMVNKERLALNENALPELDPTTLRWVKGADPIEVFFINEGAGFRNQLLYSINGGEKQMLFSDIASPESILKESDGPLKLGDGVNLGKFEGNTTIDLFVKANGYRGGNNVYGADTAANPDGLQHVIAYSYFDKVAKQSYVLLGFEDLFGEKYATGGKNQNSDRDFNDVVVVLRGVTGDPVSSVPEPTSALALLGVIGFGASRLRRNNVG